MKRFSTSYQLKQQFSLVCIPIPRALCTPQSRYRSNGVSIIPLPHRTIRLQPYFHLLMLTKTKKTSSSCVNRKKLLFRQPHHTHAQGERKQQQNRFYFHQNPDTELKPRETSTRQNTPNSTLAPGFLLSSDRQEDLRSFLCRRPQRWGRKNGKTFNCRTSPSTPPTCSPPSVHISTKNLQYWLLKTAIVSSVPISLYSNLPSSFGLF